MRSVLIFGDSIAYGSEVHFEQAWAHRLAKDLMDNDDETAVYPLGIPGETTVSLLGHLENDIKAHTHHLQKGDRAIILIGIGANDAKCLGGPTIQVTSPERFKDNIRQMNEMVDRVLGGREIDVHLVFVGLIPVDESLVNPVGEEYFTNQRTREYNELIKVFCEEKGSLIIDILQGWLEDDYRALLHDGVHPNERGHERLFAEIKEALGKNGVLEVG